MDTDLPRPADTTPNNKSSKDTQQGAAADSQAFTVTITEAFSVNDDPYRWTPFRKVREGYLESSVPPLTKDFFNLEFDSNYNICGVCGRRFGGQYSEPEVK